MKKHLIIALFIVLVCGLQNASAQFTIKIPKLPKPEKTKENSPQSSEQSSEQQRNLGIILELVANPFLGLGIANGLPPPHREVLPKAGKLETCLK